MNGTGAHGGRRCDAGPREPWHDIHCRLEGPAAWDILTNFEQRWNKQGKNPNALLRMSDVPGLVVTVTQGRDDGNPAVMVLPPDTQEEFRAQVGAGLTNA